MILLILLAAIGMVLAVAVIILPVALVLWLNRPNKPIKTRTRNKFRS